LLIRHSKYSAILSKNTLLQTAFSAILDTGDGQLTGCLWSEILCLSQEDRNLSPLIIKLNLLSNSCKHVEILPTQCPREAFENWVFVRKFQDLKLQRGVSPEILKKRVSQNASANYDNYHLTPLTRPARYCDNKKRPYIID